MALADPVREVGPGERAPPPDPEAGAVEPWEEGDSELTSPLRW